MEEDKKMVVFEILRKEVEYENSTGEVEQKYHDGDIVLSADDYYGETFFIKEKYLHSFLDELNILIEQYSQEND